MVHVKYVCEKNTKHVLMLCEFLHCHLKQDELIVSSAISIVNYGNFCSANI